MKCDDVDGRAAARKLRASCSLHRRLLRVTDSPVFMPAEPAAPASVHSCYANAGEWRPPPFRAIQDGEFLGQQITRIMLHAITPWMAERLEQPGRTSGGILCVRTPIVERTFGWLMHQRRLVRHYETTEASAVAWIYIAMIRIQLRRLA